MELGGKQRKWRRPITALFKGLVKKYRWGWAGAERGWVMRF